MPHELANFNFTKKLSKTPLVTIYKELLRPHLDFCDIIYAQPNNESFSKKNREDLYITVLAITDAIKLTTQSLRVSYAVN